MKKLVVLALAVLFLSCNHSESEPEDVIDCEDAQFWDYPPGMGDWAHLAANQIPENILFCLSTERLTDLCVRYPFLSTVFLHNFLDNGLKQLYSTFSGIRELFKRKDASKELVKHYISLMQTFEFTGYYIKSVDNLEVLLGFYAQKSDNISEEDCKNLLQSLLYGHEKEVIYDDPNYSYPFPINFWARAHLIIKISPESIEKIPSMVFNALIPREYMDIINELSYQLIK